MDLGRLRVIRRVEGEGKEMIESWTDGGGVEKDMLRRDEIWKTRTGQGVRERMYLLNGGLERESDMQIHGN
jgi:hypothetical protein